ncbi:type II secretion system GspH family protein [Cellulomonas sp. DKR-3]|uniref:Type II secretion system GspH family protein n=1 Tax=Cellulomonas fulva TaxID=2835530 RepID=A0ABS5TXS1_9CELL|nr:type II secretion system GspH family protein [Cellulomonas fulva]
MRQGRGRGRVLLDPADLERWAAPRPATPRRPPRRTGTDRGFTLVELLVVVIIIGILAGIAIPVFMNQKAKAHDAAVKAQAATVAKSVEAAFTDGAGIVTGDSSTGSVAVNGGSQKVVTTDGVRWAASGTANGYCIALASDGRGARFTDASPLYYDSTKGGILPPGSSCSGSAPTIPNRTGTPLPPLPACTVYSAGGVVDAMRTCTVAVGSWTTWSTSASGGASIAAVVTITPSPVVTSYAVIRWDLSAGPSRTLPAGWDWAQQVPVGKNLVSACAFDGANAVITATTAPGSTAPTTPQFSFASSGTSAC